MPSNLQCVHAHIIHIPGPPNNDNAYLRKDNADVSMIYDVINHAIITPVFCKMSGGGGTRLSTQNRHSDTLTAIFVLRLDR